MNNVQKGYWSIAAQKHLKKFVIDSPHMDEFDSLNVAGKAGRLMGVIRGNRQIGEIIKLEKMASSVGIGRSELHRIILPELERASDKQVEIRKNAANEIIGIEEYIFSNEQVLEIAGQFFEHIGPKNVERIAILAMDETKKIPLLESEMMDTLLNKGFMEKDIQLSCTLQEHFKLLQKLGKGKEPIYSNEYVWGPNHQKIAYAIRQIEFDKKQNLKNVIELVQNHQGYPLEKLQTIDSELLLLAKKTGIINPTTIVSSRGIKKEFGFSSKLFEYTLYDDDILDDVKLLLASIRFGENYTEYSTLNDSRKFLVALIERDKVGPHSANGKDYMLLEKRGIVKAEHAFGDRYYLRLIRKDVGKAALKILSNPQFDINLEVGDSDIGAIMQYKSFQSPEEYRLELAKSPENVAEAEEYLARVLRDEIL